MTTLAPLPGAQPTSQIDPSNDKLNSAISNARSTVNRHVNLTDAGSIRTLEIDVQTDNGPFKIDMSSIPGFSDRSINSIRRAWWNDTGDSSTPVRLRPVILGSLDRVYTQWLSDGPGEPMWFAIEGYTFYLLPGPSTAGQLRFMAGCGLQDPLDDTDGFDQIPEDYDPAVLYIALVELAKMMPNDVEMRTRAEAFTPDAAAGLERLAAWYNGGANEEVESTLIFDARPMRRFGRMRR